MKQLLAFFLLLASLFAAAQTSSAISGNDPKVQWMDAQWASAPPKDASLSFLMVQNAGHPGAISTGPDNLFSPGAHSTDSPACNVFISYATMLAAPAPTTNTLAQTLGYWSPGDNGGGTYYYTGSEWKLKVANVANVRQFGAKGDSITDDKTAIQAAFDFAYTNNLAVYFPPGRFMISGPISINNHIRIKGSNSYHTGSASMQWQCALVLSYPGKMFVGTHPGNSDTLFQTNGTIEDMVFAGNGTTSTCFDFIRFNGSDISRNQFYNFNYVFNGTLNSVTYVHHNRFINTLTSVLSSAQMAAPTSTLVDSWIHHNYLNGNTAGTDSLLNIINGSTFSISDNYIDYALIGIKLTNSSTDGEIKSNIFDVCIKGIDVVSATNINISNNNILRSSYRTAGGTTGGAAYFKGMSSTDSAFWSSPANPWIFCIIGTGSNSMSISNNNGSTSDRIVEAMKYGYYGIRTFGNVNKWNKTSTGTINLNRMRDLTNPLDGTDLYFEELTLKTVTSLPTLPVDGSGAARASFPGQMLINNNQLFVNSGDSSWVQLTGLVAKFNSTALSSTSITATYLNTTYSLADVPIGGVVVFLNLTDKPTMTEETRRTGATTWTSTFTTKL